MRIFLRGSVGARRRLRSAQNKKTSDGGVGGVTNAQHGAEPDLLCGYEPLMEGIYRAIHIDCPLMPSCFADAAIDIMKCYATVAKW